MCALAGARHSLAPDRDLHPTSVPVPRWHHAQCFFSKFPEVTLPALAGVDGLSEEDRGVLEKFCGGGDEAAAKPPEESPASAAAAKGPSTPSKKRARGGRKGKAATAAPASPKSKTELLEAQNREYWAMRDLLSDKVSRDWIVEVLTENGYLTSGGRDRCADRPPIAPQGALTRARDTGLSSAARMACSSAP